MCVHLAGLQAMYGPNEGLVSSECVGELFEDDSCLRVGSAWNRGMDGNAVDRQTCSGEVGRNELTPI